MYLSDDREGELGGSVTTSHVIFKLCVTGGGGDGKLLLKEERAPNIRSSISDAQCSSAAA